MEKIDYTLVGDGNSDKCLIRVLEWSLRRFFKDVPINGKWADLSRSRDCPRSLLERIHSAIKHYQPDLLFIHRDAEAQDSQLRFDEISAAISELQRCQPRIALPHICVVPIRMTEAWLLFDEMALRKAAGNPNGHVSIDLPPIKMLESIPNPKQILFNLLTEASELRGRHKKMFKPDKHRFLITDNIDDFSPLMALGAFRRLQEDIKRFSETSVIKLDVR